MAAPPAPARLTVVNLTDYPWDLAITAAGGAGSRHERVPSRGERVIELAGGDYDVLQSAVAGDGQSDLRRQLSFRLAPGQTYRWRLATLLSAGPAVLP